MNKTNLAIDFGIFGAFLVAMSPQLTGISLHEWLSVALAGTIMVHLLMHWSWITSVAGKFFKKLWHTSRLKFVVDSLLFIAFTGIMVSGLMISRAVMPALGIRLGEGFSWRMIHSTSTSLGMLLVGLHFALSWNWVVSAVKRYIISPVAGLFKPTRPQPVQSSNMQMATVPVTVDIRSKE